MGILLASAAFFTLALVGVGVYLIWGDTLSQGSGGGLHVYVQSPPVAALGEEVQVLVTVRNDTQDFVSVDEIRLPQALLDSAPVASIIPGTLSHTDYDGEIGYQIGFLMAPGQLHEFVVTLIPRQTDDVIGDLTVIAGGGKWQAETGFRLVFQEVVAEAPVVTQPPIALPPTAAPPTATSVTPTGTATPVMIPYASVVRITARLKHSSYLKDAWQGSGTIISEDGLILTNAHIVSPGQQFRPDVWMISITDDPAVPPTDMYFAEPLSINEDLDLAVFRIVSDLHYKPVDPDSMHLTAVPIGDSNQLKLGDPLTIMGYPGIGGDTITLTRGDVGGFTLEGQLTEPAFIKTSGAISGGTSGGMAMDQYGRLVAIPTQLGYGQSQGEVVDCRVLADTNGDGRVDPRDVCIPVGGFINALRPINLAKPLIDEAMQIVKGGGAIVAATPTP